MYRDLPNVMANELDFAISRLVYYIMYPVINYISLEHYNHEDMLIYSKISTLMSTILAIHNNIDSAPARLSLHLIVLLLTHMFGL